MNIDLSTIPPINLIIIGCFAIIIIILVIVLLVVIKKLGLKKIGPIPLEFEDRDSMASLNRKNDQADSNLRDRMRDYVDELGETMEACIECDALTAYALSSSLRFPFYKTVNNNHFTTVLMPENIAGYKERLIIQLQNRYHKVEKLSNGGLPPFSDKKEIVVEWVEKFICFLKGEVVITCKEKLKNNEQYKKSIKSTRWNDIISENEEKNKRYIKELEK